MRGERRVFVTGGAGCVGHYVVERLLSSPGNEVHVLLRDPSRLRPDLRERVVVHEGDLARPDGFLHVLPGMHAAVLTAAAWGGEEARQVNVLTTWSILDALDPELCRRVVYFSTASLLGPDGGVLDAAREHGTGYIRQKYEALAGIPRTRLADRVVTAFPTVVLGGDARHPFSHASRGVLTALRYMWLARFFTLDGRFHVVHAHDIARVVEHLLDAEPGALPDQVILGNPALEVGDAIRQLAASQGLDAVPQFDLTGLALALPYVAGHKFTTWDRWCLHHRDMAYPVFDIAGSLGPSGFETLAGILHALQADHTDATGPTRQTDATGPTRHTDATGPTRQTATIGPIDRPDKSDKEAPCGPLPC